MLTRNLLRKPLKRLTMLSNQSDRKQMKNALSRESAFFIYYVAKANRYCTQL